MDIGAYEELKGARRGEEQNQMNGRFRKNLIIIVSTLILCIFYFGLMRFEKAERALCTKETPLVIVKTAQGCAMCGSTVGYISEVVTYRYQIDGREYIREVERENSLRRDDRHYYKKLCYAADNPEIAYPADDAEQCGQD